MIRQSAAGNSLHLSWRPPKFTNGHINGYVIQYTTNRRAHDRDWFVEAVVGDGTKATIRNLLPNTKYYFKMSARNTKGNVGFYSYFISKLYIPPFFVCNFLIWEVSYHSIHLKFSFSLPPNNSIRLHTKIDPKFTQHQCIIVAEIQIENSYLISFSQNKCRIGCFDKNIVKIL